MGKHRTAEHWEERYRTGDMPWDSGEAEPQLIEVLEELGLGAGRVLEIGCGTGTDAIELARRGFEVLAVDIAQGAIDRARRKAETAGVQGVAFRRLDVVASAPVEPRWADFVFDRGCFHALTDEQRVRFVLRVADALPPGDYWLCLCGNADEKSDGGPPRLSATQIISVVEPHFELQKLVRKQFERLRDSHEPSHLSWQVLLRRRVTFNGESSSSAT